jgi:Right handed beta helix region
LFFTSFGNQISERLDKAQHHNSRCHLTASPSNATKPTHSDQDGDNMPTALLPPEIVNARLFCAGNGTTDDTEALQSLLNAGGDIYLPFGASFLVTSLTFAIPGTRLFGPGKLLWSAAATNHLLSMGNGSVNMTVEGIEIDGSQAGGRAALTSAVSEPATVLNVETFLGSFPTGTHITLGVGTANQETVIVASGSTTTKVNLTVATTKTHAVGDMITWSPGEALIVKGFGHEIRDLYIHDTPEHGIYVFGDTLATTTLSSSVAAGAQTLPVGSSTGFVAGQPLYIASALGSAATTLSANTALNATTFTVASATGFSPGQKLLIGAGTANLEETIVQSVSGSSITVTYPLTHTHSLGDKVTAVTYEANIVQSITPTTITMKMPTWFAHSSGDVVRQPPVQQISITGCKIENTTGGGVFFSSVNVDGSQAPTDCVIEDNVTDTTGLAGISVEGRRILIEGNSVRNAGYMPPNQDGITFYTHANEDISVTGNIVSLSGNNGIHGGGNRVSITGNTITTDNPTFSGGYGIIVSSDPNSGPSYSFDCEISGNRLVDVRTGTGIQVSGYSGVVIAGNEIRSVNTHGISVSENAGSANVLGPDSVLINGNSIRTVTVGDAIRLSSVTRATIAGNTLLDCGQYGVSVGDGSGPQSLDVVVTGNTIDNCALGAVTTGGTPNRVNVAGNVISKCTSTPILNNGTVRGLAANGNLTDQGIPTIASATSITVPLGIDTVLVSGTTTITTVTGGSGFPGRRITLIFTGALTVNSTGNILLAGGSFTTAANSTLTLVCDGSGTWYEAGRKA